MSCPLFFCKGFVKCKNSCTPNYICNKIYQPPANLFSEVVQPFGCNFVNIDSGTQILFEKNELVVPLKPDYAKTQFFFIYPVNAETLTIIENQPYVEIGVNKPVAIFYKNSMSDKETYILNHTSIESITKNSEFESVSSTLISKIENFPVLDPSFLFYLVNADYPSYEGALMYSQILIIQTNPSVLTVSSINECNTEGNTILYSQPNIENMATCKTIEEVCSGNCSLYKFQLTTIIGCNPPLSIGGGGNTPLQIAAIVISIFLLIFFIILFVKWFYYKPIPHSTFTTSEEHPY